MNPEAWIALVGVALTGGSALVVISFKLGGLSQRVTQQEKDSDSLEQRVDGLDTWRIDMSGDVRVMRVLLENINGAINSRKSA